MRKDRLPSVDPPAYGCDNCGGTPSLLIDGLCPHCRHYLEAFARHRPTFRPKQYRDLLEYLEGIQVELRAASREFKKDRDLHRMLTVQYTANQSSIDAVKERMKDGRYFK